MTDNKLRQAAQQALEALEFEAGGWEYPPPKTAAAITALRAALAEQPAEQGDDFSQCKPPMRHIPGVRVDLLRKAAAPEAPQPTKPAEQEPVAAQHRFRHSQKGTPDWSVWQPCKVAQRPAWEVDSQGYEVEYRALYTAPQPRRRLTDEEIDNTTRKQVDDLLDHIYEYGTAAEGIDYRVRAIARAIERAHGIGGQK